MTCGAGLPTAPLAFSYESLLRHLSSVRRAAVVRFPGLRCLAVGLAVRPVSRPEVVQTLMINPYENFSPWENVTGWVNQFSSAISPLYWGTEDGSFLGLPVVVVVVVGFFVARRWMRKL